MSDHALATVTITPRGVWLVLSRMGPPRGLLYWRSKFSPLYHGNTFSQPDQPNLPYTFPSTPNSPELKLHQAPVFGHLAILGTTTTLRHPKTSD